VRCEESWLAITVAIVCLGGCEAFDETLLNPPDVGPGCDLNRPPSRPDGDGSGDDGETYFFAIRDLLIDQRDDRWRTIGYDLDGICSQEPDVRVECRAPSMSAPPAPDGERGLDNALGKELLPIVLVALPGISEEIRGFQDFGIGVTLVEITGWNGMSDDARVEATMSQSIFGTTREPPPVESWSITDLELTINGETYPPAGWEGEDIWFARDDNFLDGNPDRPRVRDDNAYVANDTLVMTLPDRFPITFGGDQRAASFFLTDVVATVKISPDRMSVEETVIAGRFATLDFLSAMGPAGICPGSEDYMSVERLLDLAADIRAMPGSGGPGATCDAVSVGLLFESGMRAHFGGIAQEVGVPNPCLDPPDAGVDASVDGGVDAAPDAMDSGSAPDAMDSGSAPDAMDSGSARDADAAPDG
jgi:hypothetical protein